MTKESNKSFFRKTSDLENSFYPRWMLKLRINIIYRGLRVLGGLFFIFLTLTHDIKKSELEKIFPLLSDNPSMIIGLLGISAIIIDMILTISYSTRGIINILIAKYKLNYLLANPKGLEKGPHKINNSWRRG